MRKRFKIPLFGIVFILLVLTTGVILLYKSHILENWVNRYLTEKLAEQYGLEVNIEEIDGSFVTGFRLQNVLVNHRSGDETVPIALIPALSMKYDISNLWNRRWIIDSLSLEKPQVYLKKDDNGRWILPNLKGNGENKIFLPAWEIGYLAISRAEIALTLSEKKIIWTDVDLQASIKSEEGTIAVKADTLRMNCDDRRYRIKFATGVATIFKKQVAIQNALLVGDSSEFKFSMVYENDGGTWLEATIDESRIRLEDIVSLLSDADIDGDINLSGSIYHQAGKTGGDVLISGIFKDRSFDSLHTRFQIQDKVLFLDTLYGLILNGCAVSGFGNIDFGSAPSGYFLSAEIDSFDLNNLVFGSFTSNLNGQLKINGRGLQSQTMIMDVDLDLDESYFDIYHFHKARGQMTLTRSGLYFYPEFLFKYYDNEFWCAGEIDYKGDINVNAHSEFSDLSNFTHQTFIDLPAGTARAEYTFTGPVRDPNLNGSFTSDSLWLYGFYSNDFTADFDITSFIYGKRGPISIKSANGDAWAFPFDSLTAEMVLDSNILLIDSVWVKNYFSEISGQGNLDFLSYPQNLALERLTFEVAGRNFRSNDPQEILVDSAGFIFNEFQIRGSDGAIEFDGRADYDETLDLSWAIDKVSIAPWVRMFDDSLDVSGKLSSQGTVSGKFLNPKFSLTADLDSLTYRGLHLGQLKSFLNYYDSLLYIDSAFLYSEEGVYSASGEFPINLALSSENIPFDDREQNINIHARDRRLDLAAFVMESVEYITGDFSADFILSGKPTQPHLNGTSSLKNGIVKLIDLQDKLDSVDIDLEMSDKLINVVHGKANIINKGKNKNGVILANGSITVNDINNFTYDLNVRCLDIPINYEMGEFTGYIGEAGFTVTGSTPPLVRTDSTWSILINSAEYGESFEEESGFNILTALESDKSWDLDLIVEFPANFWVKNSDINAEFSGNLNIVRQSGIYNFLGNLEVIRGKIYLYDKTYRMTPGGQIIYDNIGELNPKLNFEISTRIRTQPRYTGFETEESYSYELKLQVGGDLENPIFTPAGETPISSENILPSIIANADVGAEKTGSNLSDRITLGGVGLLANQMSRIGTRSLGVETFEINPNYRGGFDPSGTQIIIGTYMLPNLYISGSSYFDVNRGQEFGAEIRLGRNYLLEGRRDEANLYHFTFKIHWEY
ncbi:MAG: translocation/assembly module TamB domain-containing protein [candidate division Zixibacteria bacterium]